MESILRKKSFDFAIHIVKLCQFLQAEKKEFVLSRQLLRSGTAILMKNTIVYIMNVMN